MRLSDVFNKAAAKPDESEQPLTETLKTTLPAGQKKLVLEL